MEMNASDAPMKSAGRSPGRESDDRDGSATRREFLRRIRGGAAVTLASTAESFEASAEADGGSPSNRSGSSVERALNSYQNRVDARAGRNAGSDPKADHQR